MEEILPHIEDNFLKIEDREFEPFRGQRTNSKNKYMTVL